MVFGFRELRETLGVTFEIHVAAFLEVLLIDMAILKQELERNTSYTMEKY